jgi:integral membrane protein (TIGR00529 family)
LEAPLNLLAFVASVCVIAGLVLSRRLNVGYSLALGVALYGFLSLPLPELTAVTSASFDLRMVNVTVTLVLAISLSHLLQRDGSKIYSGMVSLGPRAAAYGIPAAIGLLPMPGGAYVSAVIADPLYSKLGLDARHRVFINYWWRHIWIPVWPLYQGIILAAAILHMTPVEVVRWTWPASLAAAVSGLVTLSAVPKVAENGIPKGLASLWPIALIAVLTFLMPLPIAVGSAFLLYSLVEGVSMRELLDAFRRGLNPNILLIIIGSLVFSNYIDATGLNHYLSDVLGPYGDIAVFTIPMVIGFATGVEFSFVTLTFPPLLKLLEGYMLALAFAGGHIGVMLSPAHSCFVLSAEHFKCEMRSVYRYLFRAIALEIPAVILLVYLLNVL